ncbi:MAG TPA: cytochrome P450 [Anaerolineales bacterium]|nr:cytochrome P450 [Anaerolineales bacterium]
MVEQNVHSLSLSNIFHPEVRADPYPFYTALRSEDPVHWDEPMGFWALTRYDDVASVFNDPRFSRAQGLMGGFKRLPEAEQKIAEPVYRAYAQSMPYTDPPYHTRLRGLVNKAFTPRVVERMRPYIQQVVDDLLDAVETKGGLDVIRDLAYPLPLVVIAVLLGFPIEERQQLKKWSDDSFAVLGIVRHSPELMEGAARSMAEMSNYIAALSQGRRLQPQEDLLTALVTVVDEGERLTEAELIANINVLLAAGHETTSNLIGNGVLALLRHPDQLQKLRADPALAAATVEEVMRYDNPVQIVYRSAAEDVEMGGKRIARGQLVNMILGAANRDPDHFSDPDRFDITRDQGRNVGFGLGIHFCIGAPLARLEGQIAFTTLLRRFPNLQLAADALDWQEHPTFRGVKSLPVAF